jgi:hypothetical protein
MRRLLAFTTLLLCACPTPPTPDGGAAGGGVGDDGGPPAACDGPNACTVAGAAGVCRQGQCLTHVPCADDLECGLGEDCVGGECAFTGCATDADCPTGHCLETFSCAECGTDADCTSDRPVCQKPAQRCVQCADDSQCPEPGPAHCEPITGTCQGCTEDVHCPNGFKCQSFVCTGAKKGQPCSATIACSAGLTCVTLGSSQVCLQACDAYAPTCPTGQICYTLKYTDSASYVFDQGSLLGVCYTPVANARGYRDSCILSAMGLSNCQPSLQCVPDSSQTASCRAYCDPGMSGSCPSPEICHPFIGDTTGREYGLCYANNGYGFKCTSDKGCDAGESCVPYDDPSSFQGLSPVCQFNVGSAPGLAPCHDVKLLDGGTTPGSKACASGSCVSDNSVQTSAYFCYGACATDSDCSIAGRTGTCDEDYSFTSSSGTFGTVVGCRPGCLSNSSCSEYVDGGAVECRPRVVTSPTGSGLKLNCGLPLGPGAPGAPCVTSYDCRSGFCQTSDARGVPRLGYCVETCQASADCADAGSVTGTLDCGPTAFLGYRGPDGQGGTADDQISVGKVCSGVACVQDDDCSLDGGARCAPDVSPTDAGLLVLRCRPSTTLGAVEAGAPCAVDTDCVSGSCAVRNDGSNNRMCFRPCMPTGAACPGALTCQVGGFKLTTTTGVPLLMSGCAP